MQPGDLRYVVFSLEFANILDGDRDILLRLGYHRQAFDSYYYFLDDHFTDGMDIRAAFARFLDGWLARVEGLRAGGGTVFLPFDLCDQSTCWLRISSPDGRFVSVVAGWSRICGWSISPSDFGTFPDEVTDFEPIPRLSVHTGLEDLVVAIATTRRALRDAT